MMMSALLTPICVAKTKKKVTKPKRKTENATHCAKALNANSFGLFPPVVSFYEN
jgi:hypothetical protein